MTKIYALCDFETLQRRNISLKQFLQICTKYEISYIQYRDKISSIEIQKENLKYLTKNTTIPIIINDKLELIEFASGMHMGQDDLKDIKTNIFKISDNELFFKFLKKKYPSKIFGLSTHNELEILESNKLPLDYIGLGAYRKTSTKDVSNILGDNISYLAKMSKHPVGAIGGVRKSDEIQHITYNVIGSDLYED
ncbi:MAG TPA: thiamine phosphate synthase [Arcobacter sp.]|nr:thiamine phosphate synthase [Arcobacter sp.]HIP55837.1 thiamine phosphate synthase [Arcobacter sp.]